MDTNLQFQEIIPSCCKYQLIKQFSMSAKIIVMYNLQKKIIFWTFHLNYVGVILELRFLCKSWHYCSVQVNFLFTLLNSTALLYLINNSIIPLRSNESTRNLTQKNSSSLQDVHCYHMSKCTPLRK